MGFRTVISSLQKLFQRRTLANAIREIASYINRIGLKQISLLYNKDETYALDKDWDVLIVLDGCRADILESLEDEFHFLNISEESRVWSPAGETKEWIEKTFSEKQAVKHRNRIQELTVVLSNPELTPKQEIFNQQNLHSLWTIGWNTDIGAVPSSLVTDKAIIEYRKEQTDEMIVQYMQPSCLSLQKKTQLDYTVQNSFSGSRTIWQKLRDSDIDQETVVSLYKETLRGTLESIEKLLRSIDAETVVISSDHGVSFGEYGLYGDGTEIQTPQVRTVPWVVTSANNNSSISPVEPKHQVLSSEQRRKLNQFGYL